jgi:glycerol-3-phosphate dehydrogenase
MYSSERMTLAFVKSAAANGAEVANYMEVVELLADGGNVQGVRVRDRVQNREFDISARLVINSAGPFVQQVNNSVPALRLKHPLTGFSRGVHLVTRQVESTYALALVSGKKTEGLVSRGGRHFFILPWRGCSLIGTTDVPVEGRIEDIRVTQKDVSEFLQDINSALPRLNLEMEDVGYAFTGLYPLIARNVKSDTYQGTGEYQLIDHKKQDGIAGIVTALGAKFTTARNVAQKTVSLALKKLEESDPGCRTHRVRLAEGAINDITGYTHQMMGRYADTLDTKTLMHLIRSHGWQAKSLIEEGIRKNLLEPLAPERCELAIEAAYAVRAEMALTLEDFVFRRSGLGTIGHPGAMALQQCATIMGEMLGWDEQEQQRQIDTVNRRFHFAE